MAIASNQQARPARARDNLQRLQLLRHDGGSVATGPRKELEKSAGMLEASHIDSHVDHRQAEVIYHIPQHPTCEIAVTSELIASSGIVGSLRRADQAPIRTEGSGRSRASIWFRVQAQKVTSLGLPWSSPTKRCERSPPSFPSSAVLSLVAADLLAPTCASLPGDSWIPDRGNPMDHRRTRRMWRIGCRRESRGFSVPAVLSSSYA